MKKILYKALTLNNYWVRGLVTCIFNERICTIDDCSGNAYYCKTKTICEFTGLHDQTGEEIFVGDIIEDVNTRLTYLVCYRDGKYLLRGSIDNKYVTISQNFTKNCLIKGNEKEKQNTK